MWICIAASQGFVMLHPSWWAVFQSAIRVGFFLCMWGFEVYLLSALSTTFFNIHSLCGFAYAWENELPMVHSPIRKGSLTKGGRA